MTSTLPNSAPAQTAGQAAPNILVAATHTDPKTGQVFAHKDLVETVRPWEAEWARQAHDEAHIPPINTKVLLGDVESWAAYVGRYADPATLLLRWDQGGLLATLDYHSDDREPNRCQWQAAHEFKRHRDWLAWQMMTRSSLSQKDAVERLEDLADSIVEPSAADLHALLSSLKINSTRKSDVTIREDGTARMAFLQDDEVKASATLPNMIRIAVPVLQGHTEKDSEGVEKPVVYDIQVRLRVSVINTQAVFRFSIPATERVEEDAVLDRVAAAKAALADHGLGVPVLRGG